MGKRSGGARADGRRAAARSSDRLPELGQPVGRERDRKAKRPQKNRGAPAPLVPAAAWSQWQTPLRLAVWHRSPPLSGGDKREVTAPARLCRKHPTTGPQHHTHSERHGPTESTTSPTVYVS